MTGKYKSSDKKVQKGKRGTKGKQAKWLTKNLKVYLQKMEKLIRKSPASDKAGQKETKSDQYHTPSLNSGPSLPCIIQKNIFINFVNTRFFLILPETLLSWEFHLTPFINAFFGEVKSLASYFLIKQGTNGILNVGRLDCLGISLTFIPQTGVVFISYIQNILHDNLESQLCISHALNILNISIPMLFLVELFPKENLSLLLALSEPHELCNIFGGANSVFLLTLLMHCERLNI